MAEVFIPPLSDPAPYTNVPHNASSTQPGVENDQSVEISSTQAFVFPPPLSSNTISQRNSILNDNSPSLRHSSQRQKPTNLSLGRLPPFEFGASVSDSPLRPQPSPVRLSPPLGHGVGHRRGGSEFVGGDITHGGPVLVKSTSPEESTIQSPPSPVKGPHPGRRGHAHRRSHAVSQSDVRSIMHPTSEAQTGSTPSSPSATSCPWKPPDTGAVFDVHPANTSEPSNETMRNWPLSQGQIRSRVGFVDSVEFIPRPLSTISSETSSSMSTVRANHSVSDSVSSFINGGLSNTPSPRVPGVLDTTSTTISKAKPKLFRTHTDPSDECTKDARVSISEADDQRETVHSSSASSDDTRLRLSPLGDPNTQLELGPLSGSAQTVASRTLQETPSFPDASHQEQDEVACATRRRPRTSPETKSTSKQQRVRSWAEMILHRKEKPGIDNMEFNTVSPHDQSGSSPFDDFTFDNDTTMIIEEPATHSTYQSAPILAPTTLSSNISCPFPDSTESVPVIDLDAALSTPGGAAGERLIDGSSKAAMGKKRLHSSGETGGFSGPGMHYHRRAESAPELEPFERSRFGFPRLGSNPAMEEAIAEEDEDLNREAKRESHEASGLGVNVVDAVPIDEEPMQRPLARSTHGQERRGLKRISTPPTAFRENESFEVVTAEEEPRCPPISKSTNDPSITTMASTDPIFPRPVSAPLDSAIQTPSLIYGSTPETPSAVSSADYRKTSFDTRDPRIHTARSSMTDRTTLNSSRGGDFSASSVDDVPSLTSSASTMLSGHPSRFSGSGPTAELTPRSASVSTPKPFRTRPGSSSKRASLASLSKLMGPYNKSKLNIAETIPPDSPEKVDKKRHRISRMMRFWKSKEKLSSPGWTIP